MSSNVYSFYDVLPKIYLIEFVKGLWLNISCLRLVSSELLTIMGVFCAVYNCLILSLIICYIHVIFAKNNKELSK